jgi:hypothetical protein
MDDDDDDEDESDVIVDDSVEMVDCSFETDGLRTVGRKGEPPS